MVVKMKTDTASSAAVMMVMGMHKEVLRVKQDTTEEEIAALGWQDVQRFYEWDLTEELELRYVPVEACNELMTMQAELTDVMAKRFDLMDRVCSNGNLQMKYAAIDKLESLPLYCLLKHEGVSGRAFTRCYKKLNPEHRGLLDTQHKLDTQHNIKDKK